MNRQQAAERVAKLEVLADPARGGTPAECRAAKTKATQLRQRFGIKGSVRRKPMRSRSRGAHFTGFTSSPPSWDFDIRTGKHSKNVKVHRYDNPGSWKIEVELE